MWERVADWGWSIVLLLIGTAMTLFAKWVNMVHRHDKILAVLEEDRKERSTVLENIADVSERLESHRKESLDRMDSLRRELRQDFQTLIEYHTRQEDRARRNV